MIFTKHKEVSVGLEKNIYAFCNQKGGVGKTTTVINMATCLAQLGFKVLVVDSDPQGNATSGLGVDKNLLEATIYDNIINSKPANETILKGVIESLDIIPSNAHLAGAEIELISLQDREFLLKNFLASISEEYNFIFIDCPPSLGLLTINALVAAHRLLIPLQCEYYALEGLGQLLDTYNLVHERLNNDVELYGVIMTMADFRTNLTDQVIKEVRDFFKEKVFSAIIPRSVKLSEAPGFGKPAILYAPTSRGVFQYRLLAEELLDRLHIPFNYQDVDGAEKKNKNSKEEKQETQESVAPEENATQEEIVSTPEQAEQTIEKAEETQ